MMQEFHSRRRETWDARRKAAFSDAMATTGTVHAVRIIPSHVPAKASAHHLRDATRDVGARSASAAGRYSSAPQPPR